MNQATATTTLRAVREHGGGPVQPARHTTLARGRLHPQRGGAINRRCAATSILPLLFPSSVAASYPTTGVRRARKLSTSLRSPQRLTAQPAEGYTHPLSNGVAGEAMQ